MGRSPPPRLASIEPGPEPRHRRPKRCRPSRAVPALHALLLGQKAWCLEGEGRRRRGGEPARARLGKVAMIIALCAWRRPALSSLAGIVRHGMTWARRSSSAGCAASAVLSAATTGLSLTAQTGILTIHRDRPPSCRSPDIRPDALQLAAVRHLGEARLGDDAPAEHAHGKPSRLRAWAAELGRVLAGLKLAGPCSS